MWSTKRPASQHGAVLIFSLVMLLLITLVGVNVAQQSKMQLMMAATMQAGVNRFLDAENVMRAAQTYVDTQRYLNKATWACKRSNDGIYTQLPVPAQVSVNTTVSVPADITSQLSVPNTASGSNVKITKTSCLSTLGLAMVESDCSTNLDGACYSRSQSSCPTEVYTLEVVMLDANRTERVLTARYAVRCDS